MAYLIFENNNLYKIAANENDKNSLNLSNIAVSVEISDSDFIAIKSNQKEVTYDGSTLNFVDNPTEGITQTQEQIESCISDTIKYIDNFLKNNPSNAMAPGITSYKEYLQSFDSSSLSYPINKRWEKYCEDNSITYYSTLQIP
tara:strand:+ start:259 stop:687 length:429 start_codon:yes stop_codon:yes gene_type:complete